MNLRIINVGIRFEQDIVLARQRARIIAGILGFDANDQTRFSTAVSEIARNAFAYAGGGEIDFLVEGISRPQTFVASVRDSGPGIAGISEILEGRHVSGSGMGLGIIGARRLMDHFHIETAPGRGTTVTLGKLIPGDSPIVTPSSLSKIAQELGKQAPKDPFSEIQQQNQELLKAMAELKQRQEEQALLNKELEDTNRGIVALYAELDEKAINLTRANELKVRFLSNMSHEFRTPLSSIFSLSQLLIDRLDGELTEEQAKQVGFIRKASEDLIVLVNDLLDLAKIEAGKVVVHPSECLVGNILSTLRGMIKPMLVNPLVSLVIEEPEDLPPMMTDEGKISQILRNLLSNAIKFTEKGEIRVSASLGHMGKTIRFEVSDTGIGIPPEYLERIFEEYTQVDSPLHMKHKGTGLGLPLSRKLAQLLGGSLCIESELGAGSVFTAEIPVQPPAEGIAETVQLLSVDVMKYPVLVIEDDEATTMLYQKFLRDSGFQVLGIRTLSAARSALGSVKPLAIILDIILDGESGWDFLSELKSDERTRDIPVFVATILEDENRGYRSGADEFITKPVERKWLLAKLGSLTEGNSSDTVLVIDDDAVARYIMKGLLAGTKYSVLDAESGFEGIEMARTRFPGIIFLDLMMPGMDGFETLEKLKADPATREIPVVIVSSKTLDAEERRILNEKTLAILPKTHASREAAIGSIRNAILKIAARSA